MTERKVVEEVDVFLSLPKTKTYTVNFFTQPRNRNMAQENELLAVRRKPLQHKVEMEYKGKLD